MLRYNEIAQELSQNWGKPEASQDWGTHIPAIFNFLQAFTLFPFKKTKPTLKQFVENPHIVVFDYVPIYLVNLSQAEADILLNCKNSPDFYNCSISFQLRNKCLEDIKSCNRKWKNERSSPIAPGYAHMIAKRTSILTKQLLDWQLVCITLLIYGIDFDSVPFRVESFLNHFERTRNTNRVPFSIQYQPPKNHIQWSAASNNQLNEASSLINKNCTPTEDELMVTNYVPPETLCPLCKGEYKNEMVKSSLCKHPGQIHKKCFTEYDQYCLLRRREVRCPFNGCNVILTSQTIVMNIHEQKENKITENSLDYIVLD